MEAAHADRPSLPPIKMVDVDKYRREEQDYHTRLPAASTLSAPMQPSAYPSGPPPPYSAAPHSTQPADYQARRFDPRDMSEKALLPSLHEALGVDRHAPYHADPATTRSPPSSRLSKYEATTSPRHTHAFAPLHIPPTQAGPTSIRRPSDPYERRTDWPDHHSVTSASSYRQRTPPSALSQVARSAYPPLEPGRSHEASPLRAPTSTRTVPPFSYGYSSAASSAYTPATTAPQSQYTPQSESSHTWRSGGHAAPPPSSAAPQPYGESVKRQLDFYDLEMTLNEIRENSTVALDFSKNYGARMHQVQRSGVEPGMLPAITEVDALLKQTQTTMEALGKMREVLIAQHALHRQQAQEQANRAEDLKRTDSIHQQEEKAGGFAGSEPKKRRGRNAAPGRCHSCNRAETPEWRRGPDGARTLCNACGLHYAKLTRKAGANKAAAGGSSLRPKEEKENDA